MVILAFLRKYWPQVVVGLAIVLLAVYVGLLKYQIGTARGEIAELNGQLKEWQSAYEILRKNTLQQSEAVAAWESRAKTASANAAQAIKKARSISESRQGEINALRSRLQTGGTDCSKAVEEIREGLK